MKKYLGALCLIVIPSIVAYVMGTAVTCAPNEWIGAGRLDGVRKDVVRFYQIKRAAPSSLEELEGFLKERNLEVRGDYSSEALRYGQTDSSVRLEFESPPYHNVRCVYSVEFAPDNDRQGEWQ